MESNHECSFLANVATTTELAQHVASEAKHTKPLLIGGEVLSTSTSSIQIQ